MVEGEAEACGSGLFAARAYRRGDVVAEFPRVYVARPEVHTLQVDDELHIDTTGHPTRLLNHACDPSCAVDSVRCVLVAARDLKAGDALTFDYLTTEWELAAPFPCACGSAACVGEVRGYRFATPAQRSLRAERVLPYLAAKTGLPGT